MMRDFATDCHKVDDSRFAPSGFLVASVDRRLNSLDLKFEPVELLCFFCRTGVVQSWYSNGLARLNENAGGSPGPWDFRVPSTASYTEIKLPFILESHDKKQSQPSEACCSLGQFLHHHAWVDQVLCGR